MLLRAEVSIDVTGLIWLEPSTTEFRSTQKYVLQVTTLTRDDGAQCVIRPIDQRQSS